MRYEAYSKDIKDIHDILRNSFAGIKKDMTEVKTSQAVMLNSYKELRLRMEELKRDAVTNDKFNLLQIKIGDMNEELKELERVNKKIRELKDETQKDLKDIEKKCLEKTTFDRESKNLDKRFGDIKKNIAEAEKLGRNTISVDQYNAMAEQISKELGTIKKDLQEVDSKRKSVIKAKLNDYSNIVDKKVDILRQDIDRLNESMNNKVKTEQVEKLVGDINKEFDKVKEREHNDIENLKTALEKTKEFVRRDQVEKLLGDINKEFDSVKEKGTADTKALKEKVEEINSTLKDIKKSMAIKEYVDREIEKVKKQIPSSNGLNSSNGSYSSNEVKKSSKMIKAELNKLEKKTNKKRRIEKPLLMGANMSIIISFVILIASIVAFFSGRESLMNGMIVTAIIIFVLGVLARLFVILKNRNE